MPISKEHYKLLDTSDLFESLQNTIIDHLIPTLIGREVSNAERHFTHCLPTIICVVLMTLMRCFSTGVPRNPRVLQNT